LSFDPVSLKIAGGYQTYEATFGTKDEDIDSWIIALGAKANFGMFTLGGNIYCGQNAGNLISIDTGEGWGTGGLAASDGVDFVDNDAFGFILVASAKINDMFAVEVGYGFAETEFDISGAEGDEVQSYYIQFPITLAPGVFVIPEIGVVDNEQDWAGDDQSEMTYFGAKWQINF